MSAPTNHWKLGAFVVGSVLIGLTAAALLTAQTMQIVTVTYTSYFDESVTGLEVGSPVRFRGVTIGNVSAIDVAPDRRHVEVTYALGVKVLKRLGLAGTGRGQGDHRSRCRPTCGCSSPRPASPASSSCRSTSSTPGAPRRRCCRSRSPTTTSRPPPRR